MAEGAGTPDLVGKVGLRLRSTAVGDGWYSTEPKT